MLEHIFGGRIRIYAPILDVVDLMLRALLAPLKLEAQYDIVILQIPRLAILLKSAL